MWSAATLLESFEDMAGEESVFFYFVSLIFCLKGYGIEATHKPIAWKTLTQNRSAYVARLNGIYQKNLESSNISILQGRGVFVGERQVRGKQLCFRVCVLKWIIVNDVTYTAEHVLIATGGRPLVPSGIPGAELGITSGETKNQEKIFSF